MSCGIAGGRRQAAAAHVGQFAPSGAAARAIAIAGSLAKPTAAHVEVVHPVERRREEERSPPASAKRPLLPSG
jgi:hypothetical protein